MIDKDTYPQKIAGVILAGGLARRMNHQDKGLVSFQGRPLISYAINALTPIVEQLFINANRNIDQYQHFGLPVISDQTDSFDGPLAGVLAAMDSTDADVLLVMPCDCPMLKTEHLQKLLQAHTETNVDIAVAFDGARLHGVLFAVSTALKPSLQIYLTSKQRKVETWLMQHSITQVDFSDDPAIFTNINTMTDLSLLEQHNIALE
jgi:molybdenum cofactor guanylyltransferase